MLELERIKFVIWVHDMDRATEFYRNVVGFSLRFQSPGWSELQHGDVILGLHAGATDDVRSTGLSFQVANLDAAISAIVQAGGTLHGPVISEPSEPIRRAELIDPEGNQFMLTQWVQ